MAGECRLNPPEPMVVHRPGVMPNQIVEQVDSFWPSTLSDRWCLLWDDREGHPLFRGNGVTEAKAESIPDLVLTSKVKFDA